MELKINIDYNQIIGLIHQLPDKEIERIAAALQTELSAKKSDKSVKDLILNAPTWTDFDFDKYKEVRNHINNSRLA